MDNQASHPRALARSGSVGQWWQTIGDVHWTAGLTLILVGLFGFGALSLGSGDFAYQWQPVPKDLPARALLAQLSGLTLILLTVSASPPHWRSKALTGLFAYLAAWVLLTHGPQVVARPTSLVPWLGVAEIGAMAIAPLAVVLSLRQSSAALTAARLFGLAPIIYGAAHFGYPEITAGMVPGWIPFPLFWAYATGAAHLAGGVAILFGIVPVIAATCLGAMYLSWALILHLPRVVSAPSNRVEWTMLCVATSLAGAAFLIAWCFKPRK